MPDEDAPDSTFFFLAGIVAAGKLGWDQQNYATTGTIILTTSDSSKPEVSDAWNRFPKQNGAAEPNSRGEHQKLTGRKS